MIRGIFMKGYSDPGTNSLFARLPVDTFSNNRFDWKTHCLKKHAKVCRFFRFQASFNANQVSFFCGRGGT
jgi:hypothetical protein